MKASTCHLFRSGFLARVAALLTAVLLPRVGLAADELVAGAEPVSYKLTTGLYQLSGGGLPGGPGLDVNWEELGSDSS